MTRVWFEKIRLSQALFVTGISELVVLFCLPKVHLYKLYKHTFIRTDIELVGVSLLITPTYYRIVTVFITSERLSPPSPENVCLILSSSHLQSITYVYMVCQGLVRSSRIFLALIGRVRFGVGRTTSRGSTFRPRWSETSQMTRTDDIRFAYGVFPRKMQRTRRRGRRRDPGRLGGGT